MATTTLASGFVHGAFIGNKMVAAASGDTVPVIDPATGEVFVFDEWNLSDPTEVEAIAIVADGESISPAGPILDLSTMR